MQRTAKLFSAQGRGRACIERSFTDRYHFAFSEEAAGHYAEIRGAPKRSGMLSGAEGLFLAAHARSLRLTLVTNTVREFARVPGLKRENWTER